jgi:cell cycle checkpoint control protein RAD9A
MSKYSEELFINAMPNSVSFSATNTSLSAYCRFTYERSFFTKFNIGDGNVRDGIPDIDDMEQSQTVSGQLCVQVPSSAGEGVFPYSTSSFAAPTCYSEA